MTGYVYRGVALSEANEQEFGEGKILGHETNIYRGRLDTDNPQATVVRGTPLEELPWWDDGGRVEDPILEEEQGVTGGLASNIGTAIGFSGGIPLVLYLKEGGLNGTASKVRYDLNWFDGAEGALSWVYGKSVNGEIRTEDEGLIGLTTMAESGPQVWVWGEDELSTSAMTYEDEREALVFDDHIDIEPALDTVATFLEDQRGPKQALDAFEGYTAVPSVYDGEDITEWSQRKATETFYREVKQAADHPLDDYWVVVLNATVHSASREVEGEYLEYAYDGDRFVEDAADLPPHLLGG